MPSRDLVQNIRDLIDPIDVQREGHHFSVELLGVQRPAHGRLADFGACFRIGGKARIGRLRDFPAECAEGSRGHPDNLGRIG
jgi:hypothetical protein